ncbi:MAG: hypothetical protein ACT4PT_04965 [Methanobacteriota archaeon]
MRKTTILALMLLSTAIAGPLSGTAAATHACDPDVPPEWCSHQPGPVATVCKVIYSASRGKLACTS